uniref:Uncharacterized protein n=1 Tax=Vespula pensylvanica TaxID=30213 RepID=A0A834K0M9_VESPE|nr:hypothetical protein H0235_016086 [Vespula pensylvanica]
MNREKNRRDTNGTRKKGSREEDKVRKGGTERFVEKSLTTLESNGCFVVITANGGTFPTGCPESTEKQKESMANALECLCYFRRDQARISPEEPESARKCVPTTSGIETKRGTTLRFTLNNFMEEQ